MEMITSNIKRDVSPYLILYWEVVSRSYQLLQLASQSGVFNILGSKLYTVSQIVKKTSFSSILAKKLLNILVALGFLSKRDGKYGLTEISKTYLRNSDSPLAMTSYLKKDHLLKSWMTLEERLRDGKRPHFFSQKKIDKIFPKMVVSNFPFSFLTAKKLAKKLRMKRLAKGTKVLDIAAGSCPWSIAMVLENASLRVDALDYRSVLESSKRLLSYYHVTKSFRFIAHGWEEAILEKDAYGVIVIGHFLRFLSGDRARKLLKKSFQALKSDGTLVVIEIVNNDNNIKADPHNLFKALFDTTTFLINSQGKLYSESEIHDLISVSGFTNIERMINLPLHTVSIATK